MHEQRTQTEQLLPIGLCPTEALTDLRRLCVRSGIRHIPERFFATTLVKKGNEVEDGILVCRGLGVEIGRFFFGRLWRGGLDHLQKCGVLAFSLYGPLGQVVA